MHYYGYQNYHNGELLIVSANEVVNDLSSWSELQNMGKFEWATDKARVLTRYDHRLA